MPITLTIIGKPPGKREGNVNDRFNSDFTDEWLVQTDTPSVTAEEVLATDGLPILFEQYSNVPNTYGYYSRVMDMRARQSPDSPWLWVVEVKYSTNASEECRQKLDPLEWPPMFKKRTQQAKRACEYDDDGLPMVNSAGLPFDPPYERDESNILLTVVKNESLIDLGRDQMLVDSVNDNMWYGGLPGTWKCIAADGDESWIRNTYVVPYTYQFLFKRSGWTGYHQGANGAVIDPDKVRILDQGKAERLNGKIKIILDDRGHPIPAPVCMDGRGLRLDAGPPRTTELSVALLAAGTTATVVNPEALVQGQRATLENEEIIIDTVNIATKTLTIVRAQNGTTAVDHAVKKAIYQKTGTSTILDGAINNIQETVHVADFLVFGFVSRAPTTGTITFPAFGIRPFIRIDQEEMMVTALDTGTSILTVVRGSNGTQPVAHANFSEVRQAPTYLNRNLLKTYPFGLIEIGGDGVDFIEPC